MRPMNIRAIPTMQTEKRYAPMMPPTCAGMRDGSLDADAESGGPSSGGGAGSHQMFNGLFLGTSVRMLAELIARQRESRINGAWIFVSVQTCMMLLCYRENEASALLELRRRRTKRSAIQTQHGLEVPWAASGRLDVIYPGVELCNPWILVAAAIHWGQRCKWAAREGGRRPWSRH